MSLTQTRSRETAPGLPAVALQPPITTLSRRAALRGSAATTIAIAAGITAAQPAAAAPDAALIDLARHLEALIGREREAWDRHSTAEDAVFKATPPTPTRREVKGAYAGLDALPQEQRLAKLFADPTEFWAASAAADAEHKQAMAEHARTVEVIEKRIGLPRLERQARRISDQVAAASARLSEMQVTTSPGLAAKACVLLAITGGDRLSQRAELENHAALFESLLEDAAWLGRGGAA